MRETMEGLVHGARLASLAQKAYRNAEPGYYVARKSTHIVVRGPFALEAEAERELRASFGDEPDRMEVVEAR